MSILLDALRKSESQRRRGELPNIHSGVPIEGPARRAHGAWPWVLALVALLIAAGLAWRAGWLGPPPDDTELPPSTPLTIVEAPAEDPGVAIPVAVPPPAASGDARTPLERLRDRAPEGSEPVVVDGPGPPPASLQRPSMDTIAADGDATPGQGVDVRPLAEAPPPTAETAADGTPDSSDLQAAVRDALPDAAAGARGTPGTPPPPSTERAGEAPLEFWELPQEIRRALPDFRITVLVYDQDPAGRFVLLNGERRVEGESIAPDVLLEQIRRDGAVFRHGRYRFLVKR